MRIIIFLFLFQCSSYNKYSGVNAKALFGERVRAARENEFPFLAAVLRNYIPPIDLDRDLICSGSLISVNDVLTAEHCFNNVATTGFRVIVGSVNINTGRTYYPAWFITFDQWSLATNREIELEINDIAVVRLTQIACNDYVAIPLSNLGNAHLSGRSVTVVGWGVLNDDTISPIAHTATLVVLSKEQCEARVSAILQFEFRIIESLLCSLSEPSVFLMGGDSGGPLIYNNEIIAVNKGLCPTPHLYFHANRVNVHFGVRYYREFILHSQFYM